MLDVTTDDVTNDSTQRVGLTRRNALVGAAWTAPVIVVASAAPAFAASGATALQQTYPATATFTSGDVGHGPLTVTLLDGATPVNGKSITFSSDAAWVSPQNTSVLTAGSGTASSALLYNSVPADGATATLTAIYQDLSVVWTLTYQPLTVAQRIALGNAVANSRQVRGVVVGYQESSTGNPIDFDGTYVAGQDTNFAIADLVTETNTALTVPVELPTGAIRTANNLVTTTRYHDVVDVTGSAVAYFSKPGMKDDGFAASVYRINVVSAG